MRYQPVNSKTGYLIDGNKPACAFVKEGDRYVAHTVAVELERSTWRSSDDDGYITIDANGEITFTAD